MTDTMPEFISSVPFCGGALILQRTISQNPVYSEAVPNPSRFVVSIHVDDKDLEVTGFDILSTFITSRMCNIEADVLSREADYATVLSALLKFGALIYPSEMFGFLADGYQFDVEDNQPRLEGGKLRFCCGRFPLDGSPPNLTDVSIELRTFALNSSPIQLPAGRGKR